jgi:hypothetical protein
MQVAFIAAILAAAPVQDVDPRGDRRLDGWREDLRQLAVELPRPHMNLFFEQPREEWEAKVADLDAALPGLEEHEIVVELMRLVASVGDGHTAIRLGQGPVARKVFPVEFHPFSDGLRVVLAPRELSWSLGARVTAVGGLPIEEASERVAEIIAHDNDAGVRSALPRHLETAWIPHALGFGDAREVATFTVVTERGEERALELRPGSPSGPGAQGVEPKELPLWRRRRGEPYWFELVPAERLLYLQYNRCDDDPRQPFAELVAAMEEQIDSAPQSVATFLIDLRWNGGGNSLVIQPLLRLIGKRRALREKGVLFVAVGEDTFSSAMMNAVELRRGFGALLVGTPTGGKPKSYGEIRFLKLAHSQIEVSYSTKFFELVADDAPSVLPDVVAPAAFAHWREGRDPALEAIEAWRAGMAAPDGAERSKGGAADGGR